MIRPDANQCDCCKEIWNQDNLIKVPISKDNKLILYLCPECNKEFNTMYKLMSKAGKLKKI